jgi:hypothetical protein
MDKVFLEMKNQEFKQKFQMSHQPTKENMASCGNCQGACFCRDRRNEKVNIKDLL